jgi:N-acetylglutamate synthase-like GNAT family acetyltransferase
MEVESFSVKNTVCHIRRAAAHDMASIKQLVLFSSAHASKRRQQPAHGHGGGAGSGGFIRRILRKRMSDMLTRRLDWRYFYVAALDDGTLIGCVQTRPHRTGILEVASFAMDRAWRNWMVAARLSRYVIAQSRQPLWGTCTSRVMPFYKRLGAREAADPASVPAYMRRRRKIFNAIFRLLGRKVCLVAMVFERG